MGGVEVEVYSGRCAWEVYMRGVHVRCEEGRVQWES